jgi:hypothetical protein
MLSSQMMHINPHVSEWLAAGRAQSEFTGQRNAILIEYMPLQSAVGGSEMNRSVHGDNANHVWCLDPAATART